MANHFDCCPIREQAKADRIERLYLETGRNHPQHPMHGLYTNLHIEAIRAAAVALNPEPAA